MTDAEMSAELSSGADEEASGLSTAPDLADEPDPHSVTVEHGLDGSTTYVIDQDGDGYADVVAVDQDSDGYIDRAYVDTDHDHQLDAALIDRDDDGRPDLQLRDTNADGHVDYVAEDVDGDGRIDRRSEERRVGKECRSRWSPERYKEK